MLKRLTFSLFLFILLLPTFVVAENLKDIIEENNAKNFAGWKGIVFMCSYDEKDSTLAKICKRGTIDIKLLAASNNIELLVVEPNDYMNLGIAAGFKKYIPLEYELFSTKVKNPSDLRAFFGRLFFRIYYSNIVEKGAKPESIDSLPRSGDLEIWSNYIIGSGTSSGIIKPFSDNAETLFKEALTTFLLYVH